MEQKEESFVAFFSYARINDEVDKGRLTSIRKLLQNEIWVQTAKRFQIFQDNEHIEWGQSWQGRIKGALDSSSLFIAVITPSYLVSPACRFEFEYFLKQESKGKLILPILYIDASGLQDKNDEIAVEISQRQWIDWRDLRFTSLTSSKMNKKIEVLARQIRDLVAEKEVSINISQKESGFPPDSVLRSVTKEDIPQSEVPPTDFLPSSYIPFAREEADYPPQQITILLRSSDDKKRDRRRLRSIYGTLISFHGRDRFSLQIFEVGKGHLIDFPHDTTRVCPELIERLRKLIGEESWRVEEITFQ